MGIDAELEAWLTAAAPRAVVYARSLLKHPDDAEDLVHDVICRLLAHREYDLLKDGEKLLFRSVTNACINRCMRAHEMSSLEAERGEGEARLLDALNSDAETDPVQVAMSKELSDAIARELKQLPPLQRAAVELKSMDKSLKEIAEILGLTAVNAGVLVCRGRKQLAQRLAPYIGEAGR